MNKQLIGLVIVLIIIVIVAMYYYSLQPQTPDVVAKKLASDAGSSAKRADVVAKAAVKIATVPIDPAMPKQDYTNVADIFNAVNTRVDMAKSSGPVASTITHEDPNAIVHGKSAAELEADKVIAQHITAGAAAELNKTATVIARSTSNYIEQTHGVMTPGQQQLAVAQEASAARAAQIALDYAVQHESPATKAAREASTNAAFLDDAQKAASGKYDPVFGVFGGIIGWKLKPPPPTPAQLQAAATQKAANDAAAKQMAAQYATVYRNNAAAAEIAQRQLDDSMAASGKYVGTIDSKGKITWRPVQPGEKPTTTVPTLAAPKTPAQLAAEAHAAAVTALAVKAIEEVKQAAANAKAVLSVADWTTQLKQLNDYAIEAQDGKIALSPDQLQMLGLSRYASGHDLMVKLAELSMTIPHSVPLPTVKPLPPKPKSIWTNKPGNLSNVEATQIAVAQLAVISGGSKLTPGQLGLTQNQLGDLGSYGINLYYKLVSPTDTQALARIIGLQPTATAVDVGTALMTITQTIARSNMK